MGATMVQPTGRRQDLRHSVKTALRVPTFGGLPAGRDRPMGTEPVRTAAVPLAWGALGSQSLSVFAPSSDKLDSSPSPAMPIPSPARPTPATPSARRAFRLALLPLLALTAGLAAPAVQAETRLFILASNADGYGIDRCLATVAQCGSAAAAAYCKAHAFVEAVTYRKAEETEVDGDVLRCVAGVCPQFLAIKCTR